MIAFLKDQERLKFAFIVLGVFFLPTMIWKEIFGIFHYILPYLGVLGSLYTSITGWISFIIAYTIVATIMKRKPKYKISLFLLTSMIVRTILSIVITFIPFTSLLNYFYPIMMIYILDYLHMTKATI